jgi:hypothetical protein
MLYTIHACPLMHLCICCSPSLDCLQYACRKTLADSRPRVQGRFARNAETEAEAEAVAGLERDNSDNSYEHCHYSDLTTNSSSCFDSVCRESGKTTTSDDGKWWWETPAANGHHHYQQQQLLDFDDTELNEEDLWASLADMYSGI